MFFAGVEIVRDLEAEHDAPAEGAGVGDAVQADAGGQQGGTGGAQARLQAGADEGSGHLAHAAVEALEAVGQRGQGVEQRHVAQVLAAKRNDLGGALPCHKQADDGRAQQPGQAADQQPVTQLKPDADAEARADALLLPGTAVLGDVGRDGGGDALLRGEREIIHAGDGVERRDGLHAQCVDLALDQHLAHRLHRLLQGRDRAVLQNAAQQRRADAPLAARRAKLRHAAHHVPRGHDGAGGFGHHGGDGAAYNPKAQPADKHDIQRGVEYRRECKEFQRRFGVADTFQPSGQRVIKKRKRRTQKGNAQVNAGAAHDFIGHGQAAQDQRCSGSAQQRHGAAERRAKQQGRCQGFF